MDYTSKDDEQNATPNGIWWKIVGESIFLVTIQSSNVLYVNATQQR